MVRTTYIRKRKLRKHRWYEVESAQDILTNILSRLPVKSILIFKSVSRLWRRLIHTPSFINLQLSWSKPNPTYIIYPYMDVTPTVYLMKGNGEITEMISLYGCENLSHLSVISSYNGLICCINYPWVPDSNMTEVEETDFEIRICNPITREILLLPKGSPSKERISVGVAHGPKTSEYKVFRFFHSESKSEGVNRLECEIYSSSTGCWRGIGVVQHCPIGFQHCPLGSNHIFVNGKVYWFLASEEDREIPGFVLSVDIEEKFKLIDLPEEVTEHSFLVDLGGRLSLVAVYDDDEIVDIWLLAEDSNENNWEKKCSDYVPFSGIECVDSVAGRDNEIFFITTEHYLIYNLDQRTWTELELADTFERNLPVVLAYTESLLPCNGILGPEREEQFRKENDSRS